MDDMKTAMDEPYSWIFLLEINGLVIFFPVRVQKTGLEMPGSLFSSMKTYQQKQ
jgi:hypothetical protein